MLLKEPLKFLSEVKIESFELARNHFEYRHTTMKTNRITPEDQCVRRTLTETTIMSNIPTIKIPPSAFDPKMSFANLLQCI
jgi:hypothetical protein